MAKYGALYPVFAPITSDAAVGYPTYGEKTVLGELVKVTETPALNEAKQYGDNRTTEYVAEFKEAALDTESTDLTNEQLSMLYGATHNEEDDGIVFGTDDAAPYGGYGFVSCKIRNGVKSYTGVFYPKVKAVMQATDYATKGESITLANDRIRFLAVQPNGIKTWKETKTFKTEDEAKSWLDGKFTVA